MSVEALLQLAQRAQQDPAVLQALLTNPESVIADFEANASVAAHALAHGALEPREESANGALYSCNKTSCGCGGSI